MKGILRTVFEIVLLAGLSVGLGFGINAVRPKGHIQPTKNQFKYRAPDTQYAHTGGDVGAMPSKPNAPLENASDTPGGHAVAIVPVSREADEESRPRKAHPEHPYATISVDEVVAVLDDPRTAQGLNVFIDARNDDDYAEGHLPGAIQYYSYESLRYLEKALNHASGAEKVIVYCGGGDCEDSIFACRDLIEAGVPEEAIFLFEGGWELWSARRLPSETGKGE